MVVKNGKRLIKQCLDSLIARDLTELYEFIVDGGWEDDTWFIKGVLLRY
jgi:hypothetical protein